MAKISRIVEKFDQYERLLRLDKPIGILLLLWPTLWALWIASWGRPGWLLVWIFTLGTVLMRSAGCVINDYADRNFDPHVERTRARPLAAGTVSVREAFALFGVLLACSFLLIVPLGQRVWLWSLAAVFLAASYPFTKRFFAVPQAYLGVAFGFGIPMSYVAVLGETLPLTWLLLTANIFWAMAYDTEYAMVDREDDLRIGIKTSAITFGRHDVAMVMLCYAATLALLAWAGYALRYGAFYFGGLALAAAIAGYHYTLIRERERMKCFKAFLHNNWFGAAVFAGIIAELNLKPLLG
ncbi:MAG: 4-hydroxybenzoate octaprenyltransferase [Rhodocyclaceae bacterium]|nr:4-hydroxybenzoate octaprenyltransferase [Rhodocyclaceae bacterium]